MLNNLHIIDHYPDRFLNYSGISFDDRFHFFHVSKDMNQEDELSADSQAGILRFDTVHQQHQFSSYSSCISFESYTPGKTTLHTASLQWMNHEATLIIYAFDCKTMRESEVYRHSFIDDIAEDTENSSLWRLELYSLDDQYVLIKVPELDPFSRNENYGFSECLLIDLNEQQAFTVPSYLSEYDSLLNLSHIERHMYDGIDFLLLSTGRVSLNNKRESWKQRKHDLYNTMSHQTRIIIPLQQWIAAIKEYQSLGDHFILDECDFSVGYVQHIQFNNQIFLLKTHFATGSSELIHYELSMQAKHSLHFTMELERVFINETYSIGIAVDQDQSTKKVYHLNSSVLPCSLKLEHTVEFFDEKLMVIKYKDALGMEHIQFYNAQTHEMLMHDIGSRIMLFIPDLHNNRTSFLLHIQQA
ncbi:hypothetical protein L2089_09355 [Paenibacillus hunanensis]|uniref:hypothetical protein n=1 Tax=Paenibacillus hunanensis TaxID=539262 RepID=UPI002025ED1E|nr:hypothetical protein [Paenibacillus hunanensis]MCL9660888.1 hypothetical protein [Paenibacillus hunanensis]